MSDSSMEQHGAPPAGQGYRRRRFLSGLGASGIAAAVAVFGRATPASAHFVHAGCCHLCRQPSGSMRTCRAGEFYVWNCQSTPTRGCVCCERGDGPDGGVINCDAVVQSAYACDRV